MTNTLESPTHERAEKGTRAIWTVLALVVIVLVVLLVVLASRRRSTNTRGARG